MEKDYQELCDRMEKDAGAVDFSKKDKIVIGVIGGDGIGPIIVDVAKKVAEKGLGGLEFASGIPGTLGGAVYMNAGAYGGEMKDIIKEVTVLDTAGQLRTLQCDELNLGYRSSILQYKSWIVVKVILQLEEFLLNA